MFTGTYESRLDQRCRICIPASFERSLPPAGPGKRAAHFVAADVPRCYSPDETGMCFDGLSDNQNLFPTQKRNLLMRVTAKGGAAHTTFTEMLQIPGPLRQSYHFEPGDAVILLGCGSYFEIWRKRDWVTRQVTSLIEQKRHSLHDPQLLKDAQP